MKSGQSELATCQPVPANALPIERAAGDAVEEDGSLQTLPQRLKSEAELVTGRLKRLGLVLHTSDEWTARLLPAGLMLLVLALGLTKVAIGLDRGRPVEALALGNAHRLARRTVITNRLPLLEFAAPVKSPAC